MKQEMCLRLLCNRIKCINKKGESEWLSLLIIKFTSQDFDRVSELYSKLSRGALIEIKNPEFIPYSSEAAGLLLSEYPLILKEEDDHYLLGMIFE